MVKKASRYILNLYEFIGSNYNESLVHTALANVYLRQSSAYLERMPSVAIKPDLCLTHMDSLLSRALRRYTKYETLKYKIKFIHCAAQKQKDSKLRSIDQA